jgi:hypothetical protein
MRKRDQIWLRIAVAIVMRVALACILIIWIFAVLVLLNAVLE